MRKRKNTARLQPKIPEGKTAFGHLLEHIAAIWLQMDILPQISLTLAPQNPARGRIPPTLLGVSIAVTWEHLSIV